MDEVVLARGGDIRVLPLADRNTGGRRIRFSVDIVDARFTESRWHLTTAAGEEHVARLPYRGDRCPARATYTGHRGPDRIRRSCHAFRAVEPRGRSHRKRVAVSEPDPPACRSSAVWPIPSSASTCFSAPPNGCCRSPILATVAGQTNNSSPAPAAEFDRLLVYRLASSGSLSALVKPGWRRRLMSGACRTDLRTVRDPDLRRRLTPNYQPMCRRLVMSAGFYPGHAAPQRHLVDSGIDHVEQRGIVTADGTCTSGRDRAGHRLRCTCVHAADVVGRSQRPDRPAVVGRRTQGTSERGCRDSRISSC